VELEYEWITKDHEFDGLKNEWQKIFNENNTLSVFLSWEWINNWWKVFGNGKKLDVLCIREKSKGILLAIIPLYKDNKRILGMPIIWKWSLIGSNSIACSDHLGIVWLVSLNKNTINEILDLIWQHIRDKGVLNLTDLQPSDPLIPEIANWARNKSIYRKKNIGEICPRIELPNVYEEYLMQLSSNFRSQVRSSYRKVLKNKNIVIKSISSSAEVDKYIDALINLNITRMGQKEKISSFSNKSMQAFFKQVSIDMVKRNTAWLDVLLYDNKLMSASLHLVHGNTIYYYQGGFDPDYARWRPSTVLFAHVIRRAIEHKYLYFDFLRGNEQYKYRWAAMPVENINLLLIPDRKAYFMRYFLQNIYQKIENKIKFMIIKNVG
jgi:CelD/BcsL family acetyltransferase involved in cellulose biosynthesis